MRERRTPLVGAGIIAALVVVALLVFFMDAIRRSLVDRVTFTVVMPEAPELRPGAAVWVAGHEVGRVTEVGFLQPTGDSLARVFADIELPAAYRELVRRDSRVRLAAPSPIGERVVDIQPGSAAAPPVGTDDTLRADASGSFDLLRRRATSARFELEQLMAEARPLAAHARARARDIDRALAALEGAAVEMRQLEAALTAGPLPSFLSDAGARGTLARASARVDTLRALVDRRMAALRPGGDAELRSALERVRVRAAAVGGQIAELEQAMQEGGGGVLPRLQRDSALQVQARRAAALLDSLVAEARAQPLRFLF